MHLSHDTTAKLAQHLVLHECIASVLRAAADLTGGNVTLEDVVSRLPYLRRFWEATEFKGARLHDSLPPAAPPSRSLTADMVSYCRHVAAEKHNQDADAAWDFLRCPSLHSSLHCYPSTTLLSCHAAITSRRDVMLSGEWAPYPFNLKKYFTDDISSELAGMEPVERERARTFQAVLKVNLHPLQWSVLALEEHLGTCLLKLHPSHTLCRCHA